MSLNFSLHSFPNSSLVFEVALQARIWKYKSAEAIKPVHIKDKRKSKYTVGIILHNSQHRKDSELWIDVKKKKRYERRK